MPKAARIVFARDSAANVAAASDVFASHRSAYFCVACDKELQRTVPENGFPYFRHAHRATCRLSAHYALRAAAQHILLESRFIKAPLTGEGPGAGRVRSFLIQWTDSIAGIVSPSSSKVRLLSEKLSRFCVSASHRLQRDNAVWTGE